MKVHSRDHNLNRVRGMTLIELLVVIVIIAILAAIAVPNLGRAKLTAIAMKETTHLREITVATLNWAAENGNKLPSPEYPGGMTPPSGQTPEEFFPEHWDLGSTGLWLDGVVFAAVYDPAEYEVNEEGDHLKGTFFESAQSVRMNPGAEDWHVHSYAMNANLRYDRIYDQVQTTNPYLTEKTLSNFIHPTAMLYIECSEPNVIMYDDRAKVIETLEERWEGTKVIATFLDGHAERLAEREIPGDGLESDRHTSRFWRGVDPDR